MKTLFSHIIYILVIITIYNYAVVDYGEGTALTWGFSECRDSCNDVLVEGFLIGMIEVIDSTPLVGELLQDALRDIYQSIPKG